MLFLSGLPIWAALLLLVVLPSIVAMGTLILVRRLASPVHEQRDRRLQIRNDWRDLCGARGLRGHSRVGKVQRGAKRGGA